MGKILKKVSNNIGLVISFFYGFYILRLWDLLYIPTTSFPLDPFFQYPSKKGVIVGLLSLLIYLFVMLLLGSISKSLLGKEKRKYI